MQRTMARGARRCFYFPLSALGASYVVVLPFFSLLTGVVSLGG